MRPLGRAQGRERRGATFLANAVMVVAFILAGWWIEPVRELAALSAGRLPFLLYVLAAGALVWSWLRRRAPSDPGVADSRLAGAVRLAGRGAPGAAVVSYLIPLFGGWETARSPYMVGGVIPWSDATLYFGGAQRILFTGGIDEYGAGRPVNPAFLAVRLALTGLDLRKALLIGSVLLGIACFLAARTVARDLGVAAGLALFAGIYGFASPAGSSVMTESLGVTFGALAMAALWSSARTRNVPLALAGLVLMTVAQNVRTGAILLLPALVLWLAYHHRQKGLINWRVLGLGAGALVLGFAITVASVLTTNGNPAALRGHSGFVIYGLATGYPSWNPAQPNWTRVFEDHPGVSMSGAAGSKFVSEAAVRALQEEPATFVKAVLHSGMNYLRGSHRAALAPVRSAGFRDALTAVAVVVAAGFLFARRRDGLGGLVTDVILMGATITAVVPLADPWRTGMFPTSLFTAVTAAGFLAFVVIGTKRLGVRAPLGLATVSVVMCTVSAPLLGADADSARNFAATVPVMAIPLALAAALLAGVRPAPAAPADAGAPLTSTDVGSSPRGPWIPVAVGAGMIVATVVGAPVAAAAVDKPAIAEHRCPDGSVAHAFLGGIAVHVKGNERGSEDRRDEIEIRALEAFVPDGWKLGPASVPGTIAGQAGGAGPALSGPKTILSVITANGDDRIAYVDGAVDAPGASVLYLCGEDETDGISVVFSRVFWPKPVTYAFFTGAPLAARP